MTAITEEMVKIIKQRLIEAIGDGAKWITHEIQDHGEFLLLHIETDIAFNSDEAKVMINTVAPILEKEIKLKSEYGSWMVNICNRDAIIDSETGGLLPSN